MASTVIADTSFLAALLNTGDSAHQWALSEANIHPFPWHTCEAAISEAYHLSNRLPPHALNELLRRGALLPAFHLDSNLGPVLALIEKYRDVPMSLADACLVRMSETLADPLILTTDADFRIYRRHGRQVIPAVFPPVRK